ncbi:hypothetical protein C8Q80DRAFT_108433 [Daedaleopsis nitida]|nr:hypothetical protein C8Q80DRAFT_108433 [Daedaleopsis nitida]
MYAPDVSYRLMRLEARDKVRSITGSRFVPSARSIERRRAHRPPHTENHITKHPPFFLYAVHRRKLRPSSSLLSAHNTPQASHATLAAQKTTPMHSQACLWLPDRSSRPTSNSNNLSERILRPPTAYHDRTPSFEFPASADRRLHGALRAEEKWVVPLCPLAIALALAGESRLASRRFSEAIDSSHATLTLRQPHCREHRGRRRTSGSFLPFVFRRPAEDGVGTSSEPTFFATGFASDPSFFVAKPRPVIVKCMLRRAEHGGRRSGAPGTHHLRPYKSLRLSASGTWSLTLFVLVDCAYTEPVHSSSRWIFTLHSLFSCPIYPCAPTSSQVPCSSAQAEA